MTSLEEASFNELLDELMKRCEYAVFSGIKAVEGNRPHRKVCATGDPYACLGLLDALQTFCKECINETFDPKYDTRDDRPKG